MNQRVASLLLVLLGLTTPGCLSFGFQRYAPNETDEFDDFLEPVRGKGWYWVRGRVQGDLTGNKQDEEVALATLQEGTAIDPAPYERVVAIVLHRDKDGRLNPKDAMICRTNLYTASSNTVEVSLPPSVHLPPPSSSYTHCNARIVDLDGSGKGLLLVSLWAAREDGNLIVQHGGYVLTNDHLLRRVFSILAIQRTAAVEMVDLNNDGVYELLVRQSVLSPDQATRGEKQAEPLWLSIYSQDDDGMFHERNENFAEAYQHLLMPWYMTYVQHLHSGADASTLAPFEYYLGQVHRYRGDSAMARHLLTRAAQHSGGGRIQILAREATGHLAPEKTEKK